MSNQSRRILVLTKKQYEAGYKIFHRDMIPNVTTHPYELVCVKLQPSGDHHYWVVDPMIRKERM